MTIISKLLLLLKAGTPLSVTKMLTELVNKISESGAVQLKIPELESTVAPPSALAPKLKFKIFAGQSESVAVFVKTKVSPAFTNLFEIAVNTGATLDSVTVTKKLFVDLSAGVPLSVTSTKIL